MDKIGYFDVIPKNFRYNGNRKEMTDNCKRIKKYALAHFI